MIKATLLYIVLAPLLLFGNADDLQSAATVELDSAAQSPEPQSEIRGANRDALTRDLSKTPTLYCVGYAHLDTQWRWDFPTTIDRFIRDTLEQNFALFAKYPAYRFNFTGSVRYEMMREYYPELYEQLKEHIAAGRWYVSGSSVDEGDVNVPSAEAVIRQVLYGNLFFKREFGKESVDFMLPDCFGFPASMPSIWAHCGLLGFSTQKLTWGSAVGIPFPVGVWEGPDGKGVIAALDPGPYVGAIEGRVDTNPQWAERVQRNGERYGLLADYHYYGVGDTGGAPKQKDVENYTQSAANTDGDFAVVLAASDQMYRDITPTQRARLPRYKGDMLLTEHSAGTLTSQSYMKRWNRMGEQLADAAERAAVMSWWLGKTEYPRAQLERSWVRLLANQMHDILPGTSIPVAYTWSWNDEIVAMNGFADVLTDSVGAVSRELNTNVNKLGAAIIALNPLAIARSELVEVEVTMPQSRQDVDFVFGPDLQQHPIQIIERDSTTAKFLFIADVAPISVSSFAALASGKTTSVEGVKVTDHTLENQHLRVMLNDAGDIASIIHKATGREVLAAPARLVFTPEKPANWPAWNMDWADRQRPILGHVDGPAEIRVVESGPLRGTIEVIREARGSIITQRISLEEGDMGRAVMIDCDIDWQSAECALRAAFPLTVSNPRATYNWGMGTIERGNNEPVKYEVPSHEWFDLTDRDGSFGVSILEDSKFGSDKPSDNEVRLTLLYTPGVRNSYMDQHSQDWGRHEIRYAIYPHEGDWRTAESEWYGRRLNQPIRVFQTTADGKGGEQREISFASVSTPQVDIRALKLAESRDRVIVRLQELWGQNTNDVRVRFAGQIRGAEEVDGQERRIGPARIEDGALVLDMTPYSPRSFAVDLVRADEATLRGSNPVALAFDTDIASTNANRADGAMDSRGRSYPAEQLPATIQSAGISFQLGATTDGAKNAISCRGQEIELPREGDSVHLLAAADAEVPIAAKFQLGKNKVERTIQPWIGFVGQWDNRVFDRPFQEIDHQCDGKVTDIVPGYIHRDPIAWFATHHHDPQEGDQPYQFSYLFRYDLPRAKDATILQLPTDPRIKIVAMSTRSDAYAPRVTPAAPLYDDFSDREPVKFRFEYPAPAATIHDGVKANGVVVVDRGDDFEKLKIPPPSDDDFIDAAGNRGVAIRVFNPENRYPPHPRSGGRDGTLPRLNDGAIAEHDDDIDHCVWYDQEGRFYCDLGGVRAIEAVNTYSWHRAERAPQRFSLWAAKGNEMPSAAITADNHADWTLLGVVDTRELGNGGKHASSIRGEDGSLGDYRYLLWIAEDMGNGTFFTEIDVHVAD